MYIHKFVYVCIYLLPDKPRYEHYVLFLLLDEYVRYEVSDRAAATVP